MNTVLPLLSQDSYTKTCLKNKIMEKRFVSRAGEKLQFALEKFEISVKDKICADLGSSTGGFVECLLQHGAQKVYAVEVGYGTLAWKLRQDPRVIVLEKTNALHVELPEQVDFVSIDVGWTPQKLIIRKALELVKQGGDIISLLKPHYEADRRWLRRGKLLEEYLDKTVEKVKSELLSLEITINEIIESPIIGTKGGNKEYLIWIKK
ncbi:TlyA family rRNA (cytidine-2'-O)-methyltransferase [Candidatus Parcubacteria bacterium]|nr:MAG: TlyA family rRNA (cytidine-2'-O)-methyltransferase [Candidatus Parcubacteria bacterium]